jgi:LPS-assembly protein
MSRYKRGVRSSAHESRRRRLALSLALSLVAIAAAGQGQARGGAAPVLVPPGPREASPPVLAQARPAPPPAQGGQQPGNSPAVFSADQVVYDRDGDVVTASGNVQIVQGGRVVRADTIAFDRRRNVVTASGNVSLVEATGDAIYADHAELTEDLREGAIQNFRALLADWSRLAAAAGRRSEGNATVLRKVVYSPCELCRDDPTRPPLWQLKAARATHDQEKATVSYRDAWLELGGVPVFYMPYLEHPDGTVRRQSGLLAPAFGSSSILGQFYAQPWFQTLGPSADVTIEPILFTKENPVLAAEYRQRFAAGAISLNGSITNGSIYDENNRDTGRETVRSHLAGTGRFDIDDEWRWGFDLARASHDNYLLRYKLFDRFRFIDRNTLTSRAYVEGFGGRSYASAQAYAFQGLRPEDDPSLAPLVLPVADYTWVGEPDSRGGYFDFRSFSYGISRTQGTVSQRTAGVAGYTLPYTASTGEIWTLGTTLQGDVFNVSDRGRQDDGYRPTGEGLETRVFPQASLGWRWPFMRQDPGVRTIVEPIVSAVAAPRLGRQDEYPNEDSRGIDLDETNLFRRNRYSGIDRLEGGQRVTYGVNADTRRLDSDARVAAFLGQSHRFQKDSSVPVWSGLSDNSSNVIGRLLVSPTQWVSAVYRFQLDQSDLASVRSTAGLQVGPRALNLALGYSFVDRNSTPSLEKDLEQFSTLVTARLDENWRFQVRQTRALGDDGGQLRLNTTVVYEDECFLFGADFQRRFVGTPDDPPDTSLVFRIAFRNLGEARLQGY